jgi:DNA polymerase III sliding clamp (beta) subunit (PCNA family)
MESLRRVSSLTSEKFRLIEFTLEQDQATLKFNSPEVGLGREVVQMMVEVGSPEKLPMKIEFNARYLLEPMAAMQGEWVHLNLNTPQSPAGLQDPDAPESALWLVMPACN